MNKRDRVLATLNLLNENLIEGADFAAPPAS